MDKSPDAFRSIGEVSRLVGVAPHVLRYWETQFTQLSPVKRGDGRRYYRPDDVRLVAGLCQVLREEGLSIRGAKRLITGDRGAGLRQIGATRLGEAPAVPDPLPSAGLAAEPAPAPIDVTRAAARRRKPQDSALPESRLPLFPDMQTDSAASWLARLTGLARNLRQAETLNRPLSPQAGTLHRRLAALR